MRAIRPIYDTSVPTFAGAYDRLFSDNLSRYEAHRRAAYAVTPRE
jgi:hypothetical protein